VKSSSPPKLLIHATNVTGLGASQVATALLDRLCDHLDLRTRILVPETGPLSAFRSPNDQVSVAQFRRQLPNAISRAIECAASSLYFPATDQTLVLGDIPLRHRRNQVVFVQQPHLISPSVNKAVSSSPTFGMARVLFERHLPFVRKIIVQTEVMKDELERSYPAVLDRIDVISHPAAQTAALAQPRSRRRASNPLSLFYPAAGYLHKNHAILDKMNASRSVMPDVPAEISVTLAPGEAALVHGVRWVNNAGRLASRDCIRKYAEVDALFYPSLLESYGLPLLEAMTLGLPIVCADLPYARWLCGSEAIYFDATSGTDAWRAIGELNNRLSAGWQPDWRVALRNIPATWDDVAERFLSVILQNRATTSNR